MDYYYERRDENENYGINPACRDDSVWMLISTFILPM